jgi:SH3-like domain-containing protein
LGIAGLVFWLFAKEREQKVRGFVAGLTLLALCILPFTLASSRINMEQNSRMAILMTSEAVLRSAPDPESAEILTIHEGLKIDLLDQISDWYKVRLQNGEEGWLPQSAVEQI